MDLSAQRTEVIPYIDFLKDQQTHPVDYIFQMFEKYDIVVLGERDHRDLSQYDLIKKIISDSRFVETVGNVFTEVGAYNRTKWANQILKNEYNTYAEFEEELRHLYRELESWNLIWEKYNFWDFLSYIYSINTKLQPSQKISLFFTDVPFDWSNCNTREDWETFRRNFRNKFWRDSIMGHNMITEYNKILNSDESTRKKALIILNTPHSYQSYTIAENKKLRSATSYIFDEFSDKVANVMINWLPFCKSGRYCGFVANGKWDAAFWALNNPSLGFDFKDSPFGLDNFDANEPQPPLENIKYQDVYTGFIFYGSVVSWDIVIGIPGIIDDMYGIEHMKRFEILFQNNKRTLEDEKEYYNVVRRYKVWHFGDKMSKNRIKRNIRYWLGRRISIGI